MSSSSRSKKPSSSRSTKKTTSTTSDATMSDAVAAAAANDQFKLIGPPSIQSLVDISPPTGNSFMDLMVNNFNNAKKKPSSLSSLPRPSSYRSRNTSNRGYTANGSATYVSTNNPLIDFFFHVVPDTPHESVTDRLALAWKHDSLTALKLMCNLRGVRGTGKSDKEGFYAAALWLHENHPKTLAINLKAMADFGYFKDLPEVLYRLHEGIEIRQQRKAGWRVEKHSYTQKKKGVKTLKPLVKKGKEEKTARPAVHTMKGRRVVHTAAGRPVMGKRVRDVPDSEDEPKKKSKKENAIELSKRALERYAKDTKYKNLHDKISDLFAEYLISDLKHLNSGEVGKISLASKWCPSLDSQFDKASLLCEGIARRIFPRDSNPDYENIEEAHYAYRIRDRLRKEYLVPLRKVLELPEVYMTSKNWGSLPYNRVASVAMKKYKGFFEEHDKERFNAYLESVKKGEAKIAAGALLPHEIIASLGPYHGADCTVAELQWRRMVDDLSKIGTLNDCLAICDVSGSMTGTPMEVCVALGLLISEMSQEPWKGKLITFSTNPTLQTVQGDDLRSKTASIRRLDWKMSTDFQKVFDLILRVAVQGKLKEDQMIKRVFVFSDMEFNQASGKTNNSYSYYDPQNRWSQLNSDPELTEWETDYQVIQNKFNKAGYKVPEMVFWNLRHSSSTPVLGQQKGVALVSGFSQNMLKLFLDGKDLREITPIGMMEKAICGEEYNKLVVVD